VPYKAISTPIRDEVRRVIGALAVFRVDTDSDFQLRDAEALEMFAGKAAQNIRSSFVPVTGLLTSSAFNAQTAAKLAAQETAGCDIEPAARIAEELRGDKPLHVSLESRRRSAVRRRQAASGESPPHVCCGL
jgi:hypothetical protein